MAKFGVRPDQIVDYLALMGDTVDNIPGVDKCGPKTAAKWLAEHGTLDAVIANAAELRRQDRREPARGAAAAAAQPAAGDDQDRRAAGAARAASWRCARATSTLLRELYTRYGFHAALRELDRRRGGAGGTRRGRQAGAEPARGGGRRRRKRRDPALARKGEYECVLDARAARRLAGAAAQRAADRLRHRDRLARPDAGAPGRPELQRRGRHAPATSRSAHDYPGAPAQLPLAEVLDALRPLLEDSGTAEGRPARQVRPARAAPPRRGGARLRRRHDAGKLRAQRRRPAPRHGFARRALPRLLDHPLRGRGRQGREADLRSRRSRSRKPPPTPPRTPTSRCACTASCRRSWRRAGRWRACTARSRCRWCRCSSAWKPTACPIDMDELRRQSAALAQRMHALQQRANELVGRPFNLDSHQAARPAAVRGTEAAGAGEDAAAARPRPTKRRWRRSPSSTSCRAWCSSTARSASCATPTPRSCR